MSKIKKILARELLDSRGNPTIEAEVFLDNEISARAIVPSGASTGSKEALELRDNDFNRFLGKGVLTAKKNIEEKINPAIQNMDPDNQQKIDQKIIEIDGTENKENLGSNAILATSMAVAKVAAKNQKIKLFSHFANLGGVKNPDLLPVPMMNLINGGVHSDSGLEIQEFMIFPIGAKSFSQSLQIGAEIFHNLKKILKENKQVVAVGDEGGFAPHLNSNFEAIETLLKAAEKAGHLNKIRIALDVAANEFFENENYIIENSKKNCDDMITFYNNLMKKFPEIISVEDGFEENDFIGFEKMTKNFGDNWQIVGDDLFVTNQNLIKVGIEKKLANAVLIKLNQIGTVSETIAAVNLAKSSGWNAIISHRSGETEDTTIADLAVGLKTGQIKTGSLSRSDRIAKYNQLIRIEEGLGNNAKFPEAI